MRWNDPKWRLAAEAWISGRLLDLGIGTAGPAEQVHVRPWGTVFRVPAAGGALWFKAAMPELASEVDILATLGRVRVRSVPRLLAADRARGWMLMEDAGEPFSGDWEPVLAEYAELQIAASTEADGLVAAGVPHRSARGMVDQLEQLLDDDRNVRAPGYEVPAEQLDAVRALLPRLREAGETLAELGLPETVQHDDLHPWNVFLRDGEPVFTDWGDACIAQPALSLAVPLAAVPPEAVDRAREAYYEPWTRFRPRHELAAAHEAAMLLANVTGLLKWGLINSGLPDEERGEYAGAVARRIRKLLEES